MDSKHLKPAHSAQRGECLGGGMSRAIHGMVMPLLPAWLDECGDGVRGMLRQHVHVHGWLMHASDVCIATAADHLWANATNGKHAGGAGFISRKACLVDGIVP